MTKNELISEVALRNGGMKYRTRQAIETALAVIGEALAREETVTLIGFGTFAVKERAARKAMNLHTREVIDLPAKKVIIFRPSKVKKL